MPGVSELSELFARQELACPRSRRDDKTAANLFVRVHYRTEFGLGTAAGNVPWTNHARTSFKVSDQYGRAVHTCEVALPAPPPDLSPNAVLPPYVIHIEKPINVLAPRAVRVLGPSGPKFTIPEPDRCDSAVHLSKANATTLTGNANCKTSNAPSQENEVRWTHSLFTLPQCATHNPIRFDDLERQKSKAPLNGFQKTAIFYKSTNPHNIHDFDANHPDVKISSEYAQLPCPQAAKHVQELFAHKLNEYEAIFQKGIQNYMFITELQKELEEDMEADSVGTRSYDAIYSARYGSALLNNNTKQSLAQIEKSDPGLASVMKAKRMEEAAKTCDLRRVARVNYGDTGMDPDGRLIRLQPKNLERARRVYDSEVCSWVLAKLESEAAKEAARLAMERRARRFQPTVLFEHGTVGVDNRGNDSCAIVSDADDVWSTTDEELTEDGISLDGITDDGEANGAE